MFYTGLLPGRHIDEGILFPIVTECMMMLNHYGMKRETIYKARIIVIEYD